MKIQFGIGSKIENDKVIKGMKNYICRKMLSIYQINYYGGDNIEVMICLSDEIRNDEYFTIYVGEKKFKEYIESIK